MKFMIMLAIILGFVASNVCAQPSAEFVPDADTVALWHLDGNGEDASGNGNHLAVKTDRVSWVPGQFGQCAEMGNDPWSGSCFNSDGGALTAPGSGCTYPGGGDWTVEAWVLFPSNSEGYMAACHYSKHWAGHDPYRLGISNGEAYFQLVDSSNNYINISADISGNVGQWVHIAGVYRYQQDVALYVNGVRVAHDETTLVPETLPGYDVFVGGSYCGTSTGLKVDEVRISDMARYTGSEEPPEPPKLLFREKNTRIPGIDHCGLYTGTIDEVWESHPSYTDDPFTEKLYYDPLKDIFVTVNYDNGVQNEHTLGSFNWCSTSKDHSDVVEADYIDIDSEIAEKLLVFIEAHKSSGFSDLDSGMQPEDQKGGGGTFTCVGLIEAAAESISDLHEGEGFIPNIFEAVIVPGNVPGVFWNLPLLTPSLLRYCVRNEVLVWEVAGALVGWFDPVDFILTDTLGRRLGHVDNVGTFNEIPNALYTGDGDWEILLILDPTPGEYYLELYGVGHEYRGTIASINSDSMGLNWTFSGYLGAGERLAKVLFAKWAVRELLPATKSNKAGRTMPVKFSLRVAESIDPEMPFVYDEYLEIKIYDSAYPGTILQTSLYGETSKDYRIDKAGELYITNFKTKKDPAEYVVEIWRTSLPFPVGSFNFETVK